VNKTAATATQLAKCIYFTLQHVQLKLPAAREQTKTSYCLLNKNSIFDYKLRTIEAENP